MVTQAMLGPILQLPDSYSTGQEPAPLLPASPSCCRNCPAWNNSRHRISVAAIAGRTGSWPQRAKRPPQCWGSTASAGGGGICKRFVRVRPSGGILLPTTQQTWRAVADKLSFAAPPPGPGAALPVPFLGAQAANGWGGCAAIRTGDAAPLVRIDLAALRTNETVLVRIERIW